MDSGRKKIPKRRAFCGGRMRGNMSIEKIVKEFADYVTDIQLPMEGIAVGDEKKILYEQHFRPDIPRNIYSHTKSFTATAAGIAIAGGLLSLEDRLADAFREYVPDHASPLLYEVKLKHLMTMSSGFGKPYLMGADRRRGVGLPDYMKYMLSREMIDRPGEHFVYSTADSILIGRMVEHATGQTLSQYLYDHILGPMEIGFPIWENDTQGHPNGGGGMQLKLSDMIRLGQTYLGGGVWKAKRIVPKEWIEMATQKQIDVEGSQGGDGYGYQFWIVSELGGYQAAGSFGQVTTVLPQKGLVVAIQCPERGDYDKVKQAVEEQVIKRL